MNHQRVLLSNKHPFYLLGAGHQELFILSSLQVPLSIYAYQPGVLTLSLAIFSIFAFGSVGQGALQKGHTLFITRQSLAGVVRSEETVTS